MGTGNHVPDGQNQPYGSGRVAAIAAIWIVAFVVGFFLIPYHDVFAGNRHGPPDIFKPLVHRVMATALIGWVITYFFSDQLSDK